MELQITSPENNVDSLGEIHMRHNGEEIIWSFGHCRRSKTQDPPVWTAKTNGA
jgi:hypothetical protein